MNGKKENNLIVIENGQINTFCLDDKLTWELGRLSKDNNPDIKLHVPTVSRKHGRLKNIDGNWFYYDEYGKNGTVLNNKQLTAGIGGRVKPMLLSDGDIFIFGGSNEAVINSKTVWAMFYTTAIENDWRVEDTKGYTEIEFSSGGETTRLANSPKGAVVDMMYGMAIYMGDIVYLTGNISVKGK